MFNILYNAFVVVEDRHHATLH